MTHSLQTDPALSRVPFFKTVNKQAPFTCHAEYEGQPVLQGLTKLATPPHSGTSPWAYEAPISIPVRDQYSKTIGSQYAGVAVRETQVHADPAKSKTSWIAWMTPTTYLDKLSYWEMDPFTPLPFARLSPKIKVKIAGWECLSSFDGATEMERKLTFQAAPGAVGSPPDKIIIQVKWQ